MHISLLPTSRPPVAEPEQALLQTSLSWLQAELELAELPDRKAALRHELGMLQELAGRDSHAVRELLAAVNATPRFKEPLERLIALIERRRSFKNLPTLLDHLCRTADTPEEEARAQLLQAWCALVHGRDEGRALEAVEAALHTVPGEPAALLSLELLARRKGDSARLQRALEGQLSAAQHPSLSHCLSLDLAECSSANGQVERAHALLAAATAEPGALGLRALELRARLGRTSGRVEWTLEALTLQAARILVSATPASQRNPAAARAPARALAALIELAALQSSLGHEEDAVDTLERALEIDPHDPLAAAALLRQAEKAGRHASVERLALAEIAVLPQGRERAALGVRTPPAVGLKPRRGVAMIVLLTAIVAWVIAMLMLVIPVAAISYEILKLGAAYERVPAMKLLIAPGLLLQRITTRRPDRGMIEVAIASLEEALSGDARYAAEGTAPWP